METMLSFVPGAVASMVLFHLTSHPESKVKKKLPQVKFSKIEICPNIKVTYKGHTIHLHHWFNLLILLGITIPMNSGIADAHFTKGFLAGGILQGLSYPDASKFIYRSFTDKINVS